MLAARSRAPREAVREGPGDAAAAGEAPAGTGPRGGFPATPGGQQRAPASLRQEEPRPLYHSTAHFPPRPAGCCPLSRGRRAAAVVKRTWEEGGARREQVRASL